MILDGAMTIGTLLDEWTSVVVASLEHIAGPGDAVFRSTETHAKELRREIDAVQSTVQDRLTKLTERSRSQVAPRRPTAAARSPKFGSGLGTDSVGATAHCRRPVCLG